MTATPDGLPSAHWGIVPKGVFWLESDTKAKAWIPDL
jgi:hypothetical protein